MSYQWESSSSHERASCVCRLVMQESVWYVIHSAEPLLCRQHRQLQCRQPASSALLLLRQLLVQQLLLLLLVHCRPLHSGVKLHAVCCA